MGLPDIKIKFESLAKNMIKRSQRGTVALILKDTGVYNIPLKIDDITKIPEGFNETNKEQIKLALKGGYKATKEVLVFVIPAEGKIDDALKMLNGSLFDYLAIPEINKKDTDTVATFIKNLRDNKHKKVQAVLPNTKADNEGIINFTTDDIKTKEKTYKTAEYCSRIAGVLATTPLNVSATYFVLPEVKSIKPIENADKAVNDGELILINDGEKVKIGRAVNSLTTVPEGKSSDWKKIKIVSIMDMVYKNIKKVFEDDYIGKVSNSYDNKVIFMTQIKGYFSGLERENILDKNKSFVELDMNKQKEFIQGKGFNIDVMTDQEIKEFNTGSLVFLGGKISILDAMEDLDFTMEV